MRTVLLLFLFAFAGTLAAQTATETRNLESFDAISVAGGYDKLTLREGDKESVTIHAEGVALDKIETFVSGGNLAIRMKKGSYSNCKVQIEVTYRKIKAISNSGSTDIETVSAIKADKFAFHASGSGNLKADFEVRELNINISGSSDMKISGRADKQAFAISGSGDVDASKLKGEKADIAISGSGDVKVNVEKVSSAVSGSGHVSNSN